MSLPAFDPGAIPDLMALPYAERLLDCLCAELATSYGGPVCQCCLRPGGVLPPMDSCCACEDGTNGQASVQVGRVYPTSRFPAEGVTTWDRACKGSALWVADLTMVVYRCVSVMDEGGTPPTCEQLERDTRVIAGDRFAMMRAFGCCTWTDWDRLPGAWTPVATQGGCAGGTMTVKAALGVLCCELPESPGSV